jgi:hemoglobin
MRCQLVQPCVRAAAAPRARARAAVAAVRACAAAAPPPPPSPAARRASAFGLASAPATKPPAAATTGDLSTSTTAATTTTAPAPDATSLLARLGGDAALCATLDIFYAETPRDPALSRFFAGVDLNRLKAHQHAFMTKALTEIPEGEDVGAYMTRGHARLVRDLDMDETHFDAVAAHLAGALAQLGVAAPLVEEVVGVIAPLRDVFEKNAAEHRAQTKQHAAAQ